MNEMRGVLWMTAVLLLLTAAICSAQNGLHVPCLYADTVDLTGYPKYPNDSYLYEGIIIPANLVSVYKYKIHTALKQVPVEPHVRGCICKLKPCVKFCCALGQKFNESRCEAYDEKYSTVMNITTENGEEINEDVFKKFAVQIGRPCQEMFHLNPHQYDYDEFKLFENGTLLRLDDNKYLLKEEYCLASVIHPDGIIETLFPANCYPSDGTLKAKTIIDAGTMLFSVPFMILTIVVYIVIPKLRTLHGKSLCCYLLGLCFGYSILSAFNLVAMDSISDFNCSFWGFFAYFSFMASFFWVSVISFDLFYNIRAPRGRFNETKRFFLYSIYAWGLAFVFLAFTYCAQQATFIPDRWKPAIGSDELCWLNVKYGWSALIYFYGPIIIIIGFNITMFILTALQINGVQREMSRMMERNDSQKNLHTEKDRFGIFLRLFIVMGVTWSMEIISYFIGTNTTWDKLFYVTDICNGIQGFLIFTLFVLKKKIKEYITNRYQSTSRPDNHTKYSYRMTSSTVNLPLNNTGADKHLMEKSVKIQT